MINSTITATEKRKVLAEGLASGKLLKFPGAYNALVAMIIEQLGFDGIYISGAVMSNSLGLPDIGFTANGFANHPCEFFASHCGCGYRFW